VHNRDTLAPSALFSRERLEMVRRLRRTCDPPAYARAFAIAMAPSEFEFQKRGSPVSQDGGKKLSPTTVPLPLGISTMRGTPFDHSATSLASGFKAPVKLCINTCDADKGKRRRGRERGEGGGRGKEGYLDKRRKTSRRRSS
jgi:hypothetical protein